MIDGAPTPASEWKSGWGVVLASLMGVALGGLHIYGTGLFIEPIEAEFGWSRSEITSGLSLVAFMGIFSAPLMGVLLDKWGPRRVALPGALLYCSAFAALSLVNSSIWSWLGLWVLVGVSLAFLHATVWSSAIAAYFEKSRGLAIAIAFCGTGISSSFIPMLTNSLIEAYGWRGGFVGLSGLFFVVTAPVIFFFLKDGPGRMPRQSAAVSVAPVTQLGVSVREGLRSRHFIQLSVTALFITTVIVGMVVHIVPLLTETGLPRADVAKIAGIIGITSITGRLTVGYLFDRFPGPPIGMVSVSLPIVSAALLLLFPGSLPAAVVAVIFLGLSVGGEYDAIIYLSTRYFGLRNFGTLFGFLLSALLAGVGIGPYLAGLLYDVAGNYRLFLMTVIPLCGVACLMIGTLGAYPDHGKAAPEEAGAA